MMFDVHDDEILSYYINLRDREIIMNLYQENRDIEKIIKFSGVLAHYFENELSRSIILDMEESDFNTFIKYNKDLLISRKAYCWPIPYKSIEELVEYLNTNKYVYYTICPSNGLGGWILAKECTIVNRQKILVSIKQQE